jgi:hypothetical protein
MLKFNFSGRPDGLGNRIEQVIMLEGLCFKKNITINYVWNNKYSNRSYDILFSGRLVEINKEILSDIPFKWEGIDPEELGMNKYLCQNEVLRAAKLIKPKFKIYFDCPEKPLGIHIRGTDRIGRDHQHFMKDYQEFNLYISKTIVLINNLKPKYVYICSDNSQYKKIFKKHLNRKITLVDPICNQKLPAEYIDLFALSICNGIYMYSKFSSFSITASLIGNIPITSYVLTLLLKNVIWLSLIMN